MIYSRVLNSVFIGILFSIQAVFALYQCASYHNQPKIKSKISVQPYHRFKLYSKLPSCKKSQQIKLQPQIRLATDNKQQLYTQLQSWNQLLVQAQMRHQIEQEVCYIKRIEALKKTIENNGAIKDYYSQVPQDFILHSGDGTVSFVGTDLDQCLCDELYATQQAVLKVFNANKQNIHVQHIVPLIIDTTIQAKQEQDIAIAFANAEVAAELTRILEYTSKAVTAVTKGVKQGLSNVTSLEHWKQMALALKNVATAVVTSAAEQELLEDAHYSYDKDISKELLQLYEHRTEKQKRELHQHFVGTYKKLREMSKSELVEAGAEFATTLLLDTVMLNAASWATTTAGRATIETVERALSGGAAEVYTAELLNLSRVVITKDEHALIKLFAEFDQDAVLVKEVGFLPSDYLKREFYSIRLKKKIDGILKDAQWIKNDKSIIYEKKGCYQDALNEFNSFEFSNIKEFPDNKKVGTLPDGKRIIVRQDSTYDTRPTLDFHLNEKKDIKLRYGEKP